MPFFWSDQFDVIVQYVGYAGSWDEIIFQGSPEDRDFIGFYVKDGQVHAAAAINRDRQMCALAELLRLGRAPAPGGIAPGAGGFGGEAVTYQLEEGDPAGRPYASRA